MALAMTMRSLGAAGGAKRSGMVLWTCATNAVQAFVPGAAGFPLREDTSLPAMEVASAAFNCNFSLRLSALTRLMMLSIVLIVNASDVGGLLICSTYRFNFYKRVIGCTSLSPL